MGVCDCCCNRQRGRGGVCVGGVSQENAESFTGTNLFTPLGEEHGVVLYQVKIIFRHGVRPPLNLATGIGEVSYPMSLDGDIPEIFYPFKVVRYPDGSDAGAAFEEMGLRRFRLKGGCPQTVLTTVGQKQMVSFGKKIINSYRDALHVRSYSTESTRIRSSHLDRSIKSLRCVLAGMFGSDHLTNSDIINIPVKHVWMEDIYPNKLACAALRNMFRQQIGYYESIPGLKEDQRTLRKALDLNRGMQVDFLCLKDDLSSRMAHGYECPAILVPYQDMIKHNANRIFHFFLTGQFGPEPETSEMLRLSVGTFLYTLILSMESESKGKCPKLDLYSAHDTTVGCLMKVLDIWREEMPPFAASITFEMYRAKENSSKVLVRTLYCGKAVSLGKDNKQLLPLAELHQYVQPYLMSFAEHRDACSSLGSFGSKPSDSTVASVDSSKLAVKGTISTKKFHNG